MDYKMSEYGYNSAKQCQKHKKRLEIVKGNIEPELWTKKDKRFLSVAVVLWCLSYLFFIGLTHLVLIGQDFQNMHRQCILILSTWVDKIASELLLL